jgi:SAM-dependent methyltransferase
MESSTNSGLLFHFISGAKQVYHSLRVLPYLGHRVTCPCSQHHLRCFLPFGSPTRPNALCPFYGVLERHRILWLYLHNRTNLFHDRLKVLHFAPEEVFERALRASPNLDYITADLNGTAMVRVDITAIPFEDNTFDVILCSHVLEHIPDDHKAMSELYRVLKPGGGAILLVPMDIDRATTFEDSSVVDPNERKRLFGQEDHVRIYGRDYRNRSVLQWTKRLMRMSWSLPSFNDMVCQ